MWASSCFLSLPFSIATLFVSLCNCFLHLSSQGCSSVVTVGLSQFYTDLYTQVSRLFGSGPGYNRSYSPRDWLLLHLKSQEWGNSVSDPGVTTLQELKFLSAHFWFHTYSSGSASPKCLRCLGAQLCALEFSPLFPTIFLFKASKIYISRYYTD